MMLPFPSSPSSILYCAEDADDVGASWGGDTIADEWPSPVPLPSLLRPKQHQPDPLLAISSLVAAELDHCPLPDYLPRLHDRSVDPASRQHYISWILKVHEFYHFRPVTAYLAVNYLDRFLSTNNIPQGNGGWPWQLLSVACLSVAAKMEETNVPLLLDLQLFDPKYVFETKTIGRMELLLMSSLQWRMWSITPFDFLDHFASLAPPDRLAVTGRCGSLFYRASDLILNTHRVVDFLAYRPSVIGAAALLCSIGETGDSPSDDDFPPCFYDIINKDAVEGCRKLMQQGYLIDSDRWCPSAMRSKREMSTIMPDSPMGVLDAAACGSSCDTQMTTSGHTQISEPSFLPSRVEPPPSKRRRVGTGSVQCTEKLETVDGARSKIN